jgi:hypothetical protein
VPNLIGSNDGEKYENARRISSSIVASHRLAPAYTRAGGESEITDLTDHTDPAGVRAAAILEQEIRGSRSK